MSQEQANTFLKYREAEDAQGNQAWAARLAQKGLRVSPEAMARLNVEADFKLTNEERVIWRLLKLARKYSDVEQCGLLPVDKMRGVLRGFVAADVVDIVDLSESKALLPAEVRRLKAELEGKAEQRPSQPLRARVYRPTIDGEPPLDWDGPSSASSRMRPSPGEPNNDAGDFGSATGEFRAATGEFRAATGEFRAVTGEFRAVTGELRRSVTGDVRAITGEPRPTAAVVGPGQTGASVSEQERVLREEVVRLHGLMGKQNHYEFLGLAQGCDDAAVKQAYMRLAREYHPDRVAVGVLGNDQELKDKIDQLFKRLGEANKRIGTAEHRANYDRELEALSSTSQSADGTRQRRPVEAQNAFKMAETFFKKKDFKQAEAHYRQAALFDAEDPRIPTGHAFCIWLNPELDERMRNEDARKRLEAVLTKFKHADAAYKLGLVLRKMGDETAAQEKFARAHSMDPNHVDAQREVRLTEMRRQKALAAEGATDDGNVSKDAKDAKDAKDSGKKATGAEGARESTGIMGSFLSKILKR